MASERSRKFFKDFGIYTIGVIGMRMITFLMVPLYTYFIDNRSDYGYYDLCLSICMLLIPLSTLQLREGAFRFLINNNDSDEQSTVISAIARLLLQNLLLIIVFSILIFKYFSIRYFGYCVALLSVMTIHEVMAQACRGLGNNKVYVASNLINATCIGITSIVFVAFLKMGIEGIFLSNVLSRIVTITFIEKKTGIFRVIKLIKKDSSKITKEILRYCLPMIPIALCWSFTVSSGRFFIKYFLGLEANGIYAVSMRFTMILQTLSLIFYQTWQETSISQYFSSDRDELFTKVFYNFFHLMSMLLIVFCFLLKINYSWLINDTYSESIKYIFPLSIAAVLNSLSSAFFELGYQCSKETNRAIPGIIMIFFINIIVSVVLIPKFGLWGVSYSAIISYLILDIYRFFDTRRYFRINYSNHILLPVFLIAISYIPFYYSTHLWCDVTYLVAATIAMYHFAPDGLKRLITAAYRKMLSKVL